MEKLSIAYIDLSAMKGIYEKYPEFISPERLERIFRMKPENDRILSFFAEAEIKKEISEISGMNFRDIKFSYNEYGKPFIKNIPYHFSVSHSGNFIAFSLSGNPVGVDIERFRKPRLRVAERFFTQNEYHYIIKSENPETEFYNIWTKKEAYIKMLGTGLSKSLKSFDVLSPELKDYFFTVQIDNYSLTVCHKGAEDTEYKINFTDSEKILKYFTEKEQFQE